MKQLASFLHLLEFVLKHASISTCDTFPSFKLMHITVDHYICGHTCISLVVDGHRIGMISFDRRFKNVPEWGNLFVLLEDRLIQAHKLGVNVHEMTITDRIPYEFSCTTAVYTSMDD